MMNVTYRLSRSEYHGIGLFADEDLANGRLIYTASPMLDVNITREQFNSLQEEEKREIQWWGFFDTISKKWHVDFDVSRFINHSYNPTVTQDSNRKDAYLIATKDIKSGEELTQNYLEFESKEDLERRGIPVQ